MSSVRKLSHTACEMDCLTSGKKLKPCPPDVSLDASQR